MDGVPLRALSIRPTSPTRKKDAFPPLVSMFNIPTSAGSSILSYITGLFADFAPVTILIGGIILTFFVLEAIIGSLSKKNDADDHSSTG